jgi:hypothetical protein
LGRILDSAGLALEFADKERVLTALFGDFDEHDPWGANDVAAEDTFTEHNFQRFSRLYLLLISRICGDEELRSLNP